MNRADVQVDDSFLGKRLDSLQCDAVINCAAWTDVDAAESNPQETWSLNAEFPRALARVTARMKIPLVHVSTEAVFSGRERQKPYTETDEPDPLTVYAKSKRAGESAVLGANLLALVMRTSWLYSIEAYTNFPNRLKSQFQAKESSVAVVSDVIGNPTPAPTLAVAILKSLNAALSGGLYHVACRGSVSKYHWAQHLCEVWGIPLDRVTPTTTQDFPSKATRSLTVNLDCSRFDATGVFELPSWEQASREYWANTARLAPEGDATEKTGGIADESHLAD
jgi:dTDP-4-dehydrorhamnose reductase